jgi:hypothetical protein
MVGVVLTDVVEPEEPPEDPPPHPDISRIRAHEAARNMDWILFCIGDYSLEIQWLEVAL